MFVKICGLRSAEAVQAAVDGGADALGFVFAESVRRIRPDDAATLCEQLPPGILRVAVMRHPTTAQWHEVRDRFRPDWLQTDAQDLADIDLGDDCRPLPVYRNTRLPAGTVLSTPILFEGGASGSGTRADWQLAAEAARETELILAGGLGPENVAEAIAAVRPWGVDVSSGVESSPGTKDPKLIMEFIARARAAEND
jgi:phosphoribosylanthranilate isomerase